MVHKQGIKPVSNQRLHRRGGVYYYRRRVPAHLVKIVGKPVVQMSLHTTSLKEAKKLSFISAEGSRLATLFMYSSPTWRPI